MKQKPTDYRNRIKALEYVDADNLTAHPGNWREHPQAQADAMRGVLAEVGIAGALLAYRSERQGGALVVIDGHLRKDAAPQAWPVLILDVDDAEADYLLATHDPLAAMATADAGALDALLSSVQSGEAAVQAMLAELAEGAGLYAPGDDPQDAEPQIDRAEELRQEWGVEPGQLWRLPSRTPGQEHRLICGDCTDAAVVAQVMGGGLAQMIFTDPPYGVDYDGGTTERARLSGDTTPSLYGPALILCHRFSKDDAPLYLWHSDSKSAAVSAAVSAAGYERRCTIIWNKNQAQFGALGAQYKTKHEPCYYLYKRGAPPVWYGPTNEVTVWDANRAASNKLHPTQKPVELAERAMGNSSRSGELALDMFLGSGTTLIAAENLSRQCRAVEISPGYVAVALQRYLDAFGIRGELAG